MSNVSCKMISQIRYGMPYLKIQAKKKDSAGLICISSSRIAFTLIELLVVIAIISLLVSILLPSLQKAKVLANRTMCVSNLRNVGVAVALYAEDFGGYRPPGVDAASYWTAKLLDENYIQPKTFWCPSFELKNVNFSVAVKGSDGSYGLNIDAPYQASVNHLSYNLPYKMDLVLYPADDVLAADSIRFGQSVQSVVYYQYNNIATPRFLDIRHIDSASCIFYDGHAASMYLEDIKSLKVFQQPIPSPYSQFCVAIDSNEIYTWNR